MSRLVLNGDIDANLGKYLPTPYVEKITLTGDGGNDDSYEIKLTLTAEIKEDLKLYDYNTSTSIDAIDAITQYLRSFYYYLFVFQVNSTFVDNILDNEPTDDQLEKINDPDGVYNGRIPVKFYDQIVNNGANPFEIFSNRTENNLNLSYDSDNLYQMELFQFSSLDSTNFIDFDNPTFLYDDEGRKFASFSLTLSETELESNATWSDVGDFRIIAFSSTFDYSTEYSSYEDDELNNVNLFDLKISDIANEIVFNEGRLGNPDNSAYFDINGVIYQTTPLMSFNGQAYKIKNITYDQVVQNFTDLLSDYNVFYNRKSGYQQLKDMIDQINVILARKDDPGILVRLFRLMKAFPDKTPTKPIGQLYKRFRQRINSTNAAIKNDQPLQRKVIADSKVIDNRERESEDPESVYIESLEGNERKNWYSVTEGHHGDDERFINDGLLYVYTNDELTEKGIDIVYGSVFFDYEKALYRTSNISRIFDVSKLESWGIFIPWKQFRTAAARVKRTMTIINDVRDTRTEVDSSDCILGCVFDEDTAYPYSEKIYLREDELEEGSSDYQSLFYTPQSIRNKLDEESGRSGIFIPGMANRALVVTPYTPPDSQDGQDPTVLSDASSGYMSGFVFRQFLDPSNTDNYGIGRSEINKYRLMMFQLLDYRRYTQFTDLTDLTDFSQSNYLCYVYIFDKTKETAETLIQNCRDVYSSLEEYFNTANELCSFNNNTERFNDFFRDSVTSDFADSPSEAPWYLAPVVYYMHLDLLFNQFNGDLDEILKEAENLSIQINPTDGNITALETFKNNFNNLISSNYDSGTDIGDLLDNIRTERITIHLEQLSDPIT